MSIEDDTAIVTDSTGAVDAVDAAETAVTATAAAVAADLAQATRDATAAAHATAAVASMAALGGGAQAQTSAAAAAAASADIASAAAMTADTPTDAKRKLDDIAEEKESESAPSQALAAPTKVFTRSTLRKLNAKRKEMGDLNPNREKLSPAVLEALRKRFTDPMLVTDSETGDKVTARADNPDHVAQLQRLGAVHIMTRADEPGSGGAAAGAARSRLQMISVTPQSHPDFFTRITSKAAMIPFDPDQFKHAREDFSNTLRDVMLFLPLLPVAVYTSTLFLALTGVPHPRTSSSFAVLRTYILAIFMIKNSSSTVQSRRDAAVEWVTKKLKFRNRKRSVIKRLVDAVNAAKVASSERMIKDVSLRHHRDAAAEDASDEASAADAASNAAAAAATESTHETSPETDPALDINMLLTLYDARKLTLKTAAPILANVRDVAAVPGAEPWRKLRKTVYPEDVLDAHTALLEKLSDQACVEFEASTSDQAMFALIYKFTFSILNVYEVTIVRMLSETMFAPGVINMAFKNELPTHAKAPPVDQYHPVIVPVIRDELCGVSEARDFCLRGGVHATYSAPVPSDASASASASAAGDDDWLNAETRAALVYHDAGAHHSTATWEAYSAEVARLADKQEEAVQRESVLRTRASAGDVDAEAALVGIVPGEGVPVEVVAGLTGAIAIAASVLDAEVSQEVVTPGAQALPERPTQDLVDPNTALPTAMQFFSFNEFVQIENTDEDTLDAALTRIAERIHTTHVLTINAADSGVAPPASAPASAAEH